VIGGVSRAAGTFGVPYLLAAYALVAIGIGIAMRPHRATPGWLVAMAGAAIPIGLTFSRAAIFGFVIGGVLALLASRSDGRLRPVVAAVLAGFLIPALVHAGSWVARIDDSDAASLSPEENVRYELVEQAVELAGENWLVGVGAGRYSMALEEEFDLDVATAHPVHAAPLLFIVEVGLILGLALVLIGSSAVLEAARTSAGTRILMVLPIGFVVFDHLNLSHPIGPVLTMLWLAALAHMSADGDRADDAQLASVSAV
jgi:hypothetical protein